LNGPFIAKEVIFSNAEGKELERLCFLPPCPMAHLSPEFQRHIQYLTKYVHNLPWESGNIPYSALGRIIANRVNKCNEVIVRGANKKQWLKDVLGETPINIVNTEDDVDWV
jgi:hypothetical protein